MIRQVRRAVVRGWWDTQRSAAPHGTKILGVSDSGATAISRGDEPHDGEAPQLPCPDRSQSWEMIAMHEGLKASSIKLTGVARVS